MTPYRMPEHARPYFGSTRNGELWGNVPWARSQRIEIPFHGLAPGGLQQFPAGSGLSYSAAIYWEATANIDSDGPSSRFTAAELKARDSYWQGQTSIKHAEPWQTADGVMTRDADSRQLPGIVIPAALMAMPYGLRVGDVALVCYGGVPVAATIYEVGPDEKIGEMSVALAERLGIPADPREGNKVGAVIDGIRQPGCCYLAFPRTRPNGKPLVMEPGEVWTQAIEAWNAFTGRTS